MTQFFTTADGLRLAYDVQGEGHPLLCLAGLTREMGDFDSVAQTFSSQAQVIRLDSRGRGQSDWASNPAQYNLVQEAGDALALLDHLGLHKASVLGTSRGGLIAMGLAFGQKERLVGAVLNDIGPVIETGGLDHIMTYLGRRPAFRSYDAAVAALPDAMAPDFVNVPDSTWRAYAERIWIEHADGGLDIRYDPALRETVAAALEGPSVDLWPAFDALATLPCTLIRGGNSNLLTAETAAEMCRRAPEMGYAEIPDRGHVPFLDEPEAVDAIHAYLDRVA